MSLEFIKKERISIVPDVSLFAKLGNANYTVSEAISELIDNSIDAREDTVNINIKILKNKVIVEDNGKGMNKEEAINSVILGKSSKKTGDLGYFGMGLKTACMSLGKKFIVQTKKKGSTEKYCINFDIEEWEKNNKWDQQINILKQYNVNDSGTKIYITKLKFNQHKNLIESLLIHLSERFGVFISNKEVKIKVNNKEVKPLEVKLVDNSKQNFVITLNNGKKITGWTGILEKGSQEKSGFNLYKYNRLIRAHEKLGYHYHPSKMWITGEIHLDPLPVTHNKREFINNDPLFADFFNKFKNILKKVIEESQNKNKEEKIKDLPQQVKETFKNNLLEALNNFDEIKEFSFPSNQQSKKDDDGEEFNKERRETTNNPTKNNENNNINKNKDRTPKKFSQNKDKFITINSEKYKFEFEWTNLDDDKKSKESFLDPSTKTIMIFLNKKYKLLDILNVDLLYMIFYIAEGIIEVFLRESGQTNDKLVYLRDGVIKKLAEVYSEDITLKIKEKDENEIEAYNYLMSTKNKEEMLLTKNEKLCLSMRLEKGMTLQEIGNHLKITRERVRQIINKSLLKIEGKKYIKSQELKELKTEEKNIIKDITNIYGTSTEKIYNLKTQELEIETKRIIEDTANAYGISVENIMGKSREKKYVLPRHIAIYRIKKELDISFSEIGKMFKRDHTTMISAFKKIDTLLDEQYKKCNEEH